jgi:hypothetical protein
VGISSHHDVKKPRGFRLIATILFLLLAKEVGLAQNILPNDLRTEFSFEDPRYNNMVIAKVGDRAITAQEFLLSYTFGPAFTKTEKDSKRRYLNFMIYEKLLAMEGYARHIDASDIARQTLAEVEGDLATEELYKDDVRSKVKVTERETQQGMQEDRLHVAVKWLYASSKDESSRQLQMLMNGISFESVFSMQLKDSVKSDDRSMETTRFRIKLRNPVLAQVIDTLHVGTYSMPVQAPDGYYILKVTDTWTNPIMTESDAAKLHSDIERALVQEKSDSLSDFYVQQLMVGQHPTIIRQPFDILHTYLAGKVLAGEKFSQWKLSERLHERWGIVNEVEITPYEQEVLVQLADNKFTVKDFLAWYHAREYNLRLNGSSPEAFFLSLEQAVWQMVRDRLLMQRALSRGLQRRENVRKQCEWWKDKIVYRLVRDALADSIQENDSLLQTYYAGHQHQYRDTTGKVIPFDKAKDDVRRDFYGDESTKRLLHRILKLKEKYPVEVADDKLKSLEVEENDPKAIDVYVVKKGGTFPRQAFPSIDYEWQTWN